MTAEKDGPRRPARIVDVARLADVSPQTVSNVMNDKGGFTEETREKVRRAVEATGYRPNRAARNLRTQRARQIAFDLTPTRYDVGNTFTLNFLDTLIASATQHGYRVPVFNYSEDPVGSFRRDALSREVDGFIFAQCSYGDPRTATLSELGVPFVVMGRTSLDEPQTWVDIDNSAAIIAVVDYLVERGHQTFGYVGYDGPEHWVRGRLDAARERLAERGFVLADSATIVGAPDDIRPAVRRLLLGPERPSAIITGSDLMALNTVNVCIELGLQVGADVAVTGFDGGILAELTEPRLTTVRVPFEGIAEAVLARLVREIDAGPTGEPGLVLPWNLVIGGSA